MSVTMKAHSVQFYDDDTFLADHVAAYLADALHANGAAAAVARPDHLVALQECLRARGLSIEELQATGRLILLDASDTLAKISDEHEFSPELFEQHIGAYVRALRTAAVDGPVRAYGEMVDVLWERGRYDDVVRLERAWSDLQATQAFSLLCGYKLARFDSHTEGFDQICSLHDHIGSQRLGEQADVILARSLAQLEQRARALELEVDRRKRLESRMFRLLEFTGQLSAAQTRLEVARIVTRAGMHAVGAVSAGLWQLSADRKHLELLGTTDETEAHRFRIIDLDGATPLAAAVREERPVFLGKLSDYREQFPESFARTETIRRASHVALAILPVIGDGRVMGGLSFAYDHERVFAGADRTFKEIVARHCALALERVQLHEQERLLRDIAERARAETELLYTLISEIAVADDLDRVYAASLRTVELGTRTERSAILLFDPDGVIRFKAYTGLSDSYRAAVEGHSPWRLDEPSPAPIVVSNVATDPAWESYRELFASEGIRAIAFIPLVHKKRLIGKFMLYRDRPRELTDQELQFASTVAFHVAEAISRKQDELALAEALAEEKQAHRAAEEATRAREEILSVVSHDLRNPLGAILIGASSLLQIDTDRNHRISSIAERIHRQAERMARLIEDLVDFAGIQAGKLALEPTDHNPLEIIHAATDMFTPLAQERGLVFEAKVQPDLPQIKCDSDRALQVISNLVSNAFKVTPKGGGVTIGAETRSNDVVFYVRDNGPGIDEAELPMLFERFWRGKTSQYRGAGLGLSIARGIVDAHGGKIWAESKLGAGSTFYFSLAPRN